MQSRMPWDAESLALALLLTHLWASQFHGLSTGKKTDTYLYVCYKDVIHTTILQ